jgi:hypothetical protein
LQSDETGKGVFCLKNLGPKTNWIKRKDERSATNLSNKLNTSFRNRWAKKTTKVHT